MKLSLSILALLCTSFVSADLSFFGNQKVLDDKVPVKGDNPLVYCQASHDDDILILEQVDLFPNPPVPGSTLSIKSVGTLLETIEAGAKVSIQVKYGLIRLVNTEADLCEQISNVDLECPVEKGNISIVKAVEIPKEIPPGTYTVLADAKTKDGKPIICLEATVTFP